MSTLETRVIKEFPDFNAPEQTLETMHITAHSVERILAHQDPSKASGPDKISTMMLKETAKETAITLARIYNFFIQTGTYPQQWKEANVTPEYIKKQIKVM